MKLFSPTRCTTCNLMLLRLVEARLALTLISHALLNERELRRIDAVSISTRLENILKETQFSDSINALSVSLDPFLKCFGFLDKRPERTIDFSIVGIEFTVQCMRWPSNGILSTLLSA